ncbi:MAG: carboxypeptidase-like regulatory domain-containing protein, partial [Candidatus Neomarinimicrobiota bacterium]|nr:carboxypeptidase-like regulatory domain-containing protein [Candidatus Neomarinimicrobiota bacterium]
MFTKKIKLISILFFQVIFSQTLEITVLDVENMSPLQGANISLKKISKLNDNILGNSSDKRGKSYFNNIQLGSYELTVQFIGYKKNTLIINIEENRLYKFDILLITESLIGPELNIIGGANKSYKQTPGSAFVINENNMRQINPVGTQEILE